MISVRARKICRAFVLILAITLTFSMTALPVDAASIKAPSKVKSLKTSLRTVSSVKLTWKKVSKANGYQVYRKGPKTRKWKKIATVKGNKRSYVSGGLKANSRYYYKVRAYRTYKSKGKTKYKCGKFSKVITTRTKKVLATIALKDGYYTAGIDIPAGSFDVTATAGIGYISSDIDSANLRGSEYKKRDLYDFNEYSRTFRNHRLPKGDILEISGVQVKLRYNKITTKAHPRKYDTSAGIKLKPGKYLVGRDIASGRYCVKYVSGKGGYVSSERDGDCVISSNMDGDKKTGDYVDYVSNIVLKKGERFEVTSGLTVMFIPEKR